MMMFLTMTIQKLMTILMMKIKINKYKNEKNEN